MARSCVLLVALLIQSITSQVIQLQPLQQPTCQSQILADASILQQLPTGQPNLVSDYSIDLCKNLATAVQNMVLGKLTQSAYRKPIFNQIAGPLLTDIALKTQCPMCGNANVLQNVVSAPYQLQALGNQVAYQTFVNPINNQVQALYNPLQANQVQGVVGPIQGLGNQVQSISYGNLNQAQSCPCNTQSLRLPATQNCNQNQVFANAAQQRYSEAVAALESLKSGNNCGCGQRGGFNLR